MSTPNPAASGLANLAAQRCAPLRGAEHLLPAAQALSALQVLPGWSLVEDGQALSKTFRFSDYYRTLAFVNALAYIAHSEDHHPDLSVHYDRCVVRFSTHDVGGLSQNDLICAAKAESLLGAG
ncbi:MAG: 4a-hydroxytetrahydrobiopterin dehydratase [Aquimonas sp.]|nr:4a-hydroxytetrahydrobiopterin dehydratase [Aquimonas sp.]